MFNHMTNTGTFRAALLTVAIGVLAVFVSPPVGAKDKLLTKAELKNLVANAETHADHERIAEYFDAEATRYDAEAREHNELVPFYQRSPDPALSKHTGSQRSFQHCDSLGKSLTRASQDARALAVEHRAMAKNTK